MATGRIRWRIPTRWGLALLVLAIGVSVRLIDPTFIEEWRLGGFDEAQRLWPRSDTENGVLIVAVDEESLAAKGQWPWPRTLVADLVRRIAAGRPSVLGIDILFAEPDRFSPPRIAKDLPGLPPELRSALAILPSSDAGLGDAVGAVPTVLVAAPSDEAVAPGPQRVTIPVREQGNDARPFLFKYPSLIRNQPQIAQNAKGEGAVGIEPGRDGILRRIPLVISAEGRLVPAFATALAALADHQPLVAVQTDAHGIERVLTGNAAVPTDRNGQAILHFAPAELHYIAASDVLDPRFDTSQFTGRIVLLGVIGLGIVDQKKTPLGLMEGVQVHAQLVQSIRDGTLLQRPPGVIWLELGLLMLAVAVPVALPRYDRPFVATAAILGFAAALVGGEFAVFRLSGWLIDGLYAGATSLAMFGVMLADHLRGAHALRRRLNAELGQARERNARLAGELEAARLIQMGLLPHRFPVFTDRDDVDLFAFIEPAREVGGDLFAFQLVDQNRLFFMIGDVSGKGIGAALIMAMTNEVVHEATRRHGSAVGNVLTEANAKIAAASSEMAREGGDMMFVTAFAGIIDLATGSLVFASAGHDAPFVVARGLRPRQLSTAGGPPLGVVDDFTFAVDHDHLDLDQVLVMYTDGVTEATDSGRALYGKERLAAVLDVTPLGDAHSIIDAVVADVRAFTAGTEQADDIALLALRRPRRGVPAQRPVSDAPPRDSAKFDSN